MIRKFAWATLCAALIAVGITAAWTQTRTWRHGRGHFWFHHGPAGYFARELDLSDAQKSQIKTIWGGERLHVSQLVSELASEQKEMDALTFQGGTPDEGRIHEITTREGVTLSKLLEKKEELTVAIYSQVLNPAQRSKADELRKSWSSHLQHAADRLANTKAGK
jgi:Spy/CpxP family protein refolding chaperone